MKQFRKIHFVNYSDEKFLNQQQRLNMSIRKTSNQYIIHSFSKKDIDSNFYKSNHDILSSSKGGGYWLWKPYFIHKVLNLMDYDDYLFYIDSGAVLISKAEHLIKTMELTNQDVMAFELPLIEQQWTKPLVFENLDIDQKHQKSNQILASFILIRKTDNSLSFINDFLKASCKEILISDVNKTEKMPDYFIDHRHDQSIFSVLYKKRNYIPFRDPSQFGKLPQLYIGLKFFNYKLGSLYRSGVRLFRVNDHSTSKYPTIILHLRKDSRVKVAIKYRILRILSFFVKILKKNENTIIESD